MAKPAKTPRVNPGGLVTVAFLKAQLDEGNDHLGIFMPLLLDTAAQAPTRIFTTIDIQDALAARHKLVMPEQTLSTLLKRATRRRFLQRDSGRYRLGPAFPTDPDVAQEKRRIEASQRHLADALRDHATRRRLSLPSIAIALLAAAFVLLELVGILRHVSEWRSAMEPYLTKRFRAWLDGSASQLGATGSQLPRSPLGR